MGPLTWEIHFWEKAQVIVMKPQLDTRFGAALVQSRAGLEREASRILAPFRDVGFRVEGFRV